MSELIRINRRVSVNDKYVGRVAGYGMDHLSGDSPNMVYLVSLDKGFDVEDDNGSLTLYVRLVVAHPDNVKLVQ